MSRLSLFEVFAYKYSKEIQKSIEETIISEKTTYLCKKGVFRQTFKDGTTIMIKRFEYRYDDDNDTVGAKRELIYLHKLRKTGTVPLIYSVKYTPARKVNELAASKMQMKTKQEPNEENKEVKRILFTGPCIDIYMEDVGFYSLHYELESMTDPIEFDSFVEKYSNALCEILCVLKKNNVLHGDLWTPNIIRCGDKFKIIDFEMSRMFLDNKKLKNRLTIRRESRMYDEGSSWIRPYYSPEENFDACFLIYSMAFSYANKAEHFVWWLYFTNFILRKKSFAQVMKYDMDFLSKFTSEGSDGFVTRRDSIVPRYENGTLKIS
jgi:tRNA A-37 threonylcarbamoyl transferase component Bud32